MPALELDQSAHLARVSFCRHKKNAANTSRHFQGAGRDQAFLRMNSPIIGQMISRQRRPEKMP
jgi:hypothetical protein